MKAELNDNEFFYVRIFWGNFQGIIECGEILSNYFPQYFHYIYEDILNELPFKRKDFDKHERLQELIKEFELDKEAFWNLVVYLYDYTTDACKNLLTPQPSKQDILDELVSLTNGDEKLISITIETESKKKLTITEPVILKYLDFEFDYAKLNQLEKVGFTSTPLKESDKEDARRKTGYFVATQLVKFFGLDRFPKIERRKGASTSSKEKELITSLLYVCKFMDNPEGYLDTGYFNKLMRDYADSKMNMSYKYELSPISY